MRNRVLGVAVALALPVLVAPAATADTAGPDSPYTFTQTDPGKPYMPHAKWRHPLGEAVNIERVWGGRDTTTAYAKMRLTDLPTPGQVKRWAPYTSMHLTVGFEKPASDGGGKVGFQAAEVVIDKDGTHVIKVREQYDPNCHIDVVVDRKTNTVAVAAPYSCGLEDDPAGETISYDLWSYTVLDKDHPANTGTALDFNDFDLADPAA